MERWGDGRNGDLGMMGGTEKDEVGWFLRRFEGHEKAKGL